MTICVVPLAALGVDSTVGVAPLPGVGSGPLPVVLRVVGLDPGDVGGAGVVSGVGSPLGSSVAVVWRVAIEAQSVATSNPREVATHSLANSQP